MADEKNTNRQNDTNLQDNTNRQDDTNQPKSMSASAGANTGTARQGDVKSERGGEQSDQISGETQKGAHNQEMENRNPQGNKPNRNQSARQEGDKF
jgi:hypothetical protein